MKIKTVHMVHNYFPFLLKRSLRPTAFALVFLLFTSIIPPVFAQEADATPVATEAPTEQPAAPAVEDTTPSPASPAEATPTPQGDESAAVDEEKPVEETPTDGTKKPPTQQTSFSSSSFDQTTSDLANQKDIAKSNIKNDQATGALRYTYPFELPKGRNGLTPDLGLKYNSQDLKNGIVGFAWNVSIPYIERLNKNGADTMYSDNTFSSSEQGELSLISGSIYRPRVTDTDFTKYDLQSNAWVVTAKDGTKYFYGTAASSRVDNPSDTSKVYRWMLDEIRDTNGNSIFYTYTKNSNQIYPDTISYTKNGSETAPFQVAFSYVTNTTTSSYASGFLVQTTKRLSEVAVSFNSSWVKKYTLSYTQDSLNQRNRLTSVSLQGKDDAGATITYPSTTFEYQQALPSGQNALVSDTVTDRFPVATYGAVFADVNGDGLVDMVMSSCTNCATSSPIIDQKVYLNNGTKLVYSSAWSSLPSGVYFYADNIDQGYRFADVNGDLKPDIVYKTTLSSTSAVYLNNGTSGWTLNSSWTIPHTLLNMSSSIPTGQHFVDYTADGYTDSLTFSISSGTVPGGWAAKDNGDGTWNDVNYPASTNTFMPLDLKLGVYASDINADGLPDFIQSYYDATAVKKIALNTGAGTGFADSTAIDMSSIGYFFPGFSASPADYWYLGDVNNDGLDDAFLPNNGTTSSTKILGLDTFTGTSGTTWQMTPHPLVSGGGTQFVDINGDGSLDSVTATSSTNSSQINQAKNPELLTKINYPEGGNTVITYTRTNQPVSGVLKNPLLATPLNVVSSITTSDGSSTAASASYTYEGGEIWNQSNPHDRKFAGFATVTETTPTTVTKTYFHQGNSSDSTHGEYSDEMWKIGKPYRIEQYDTTSHLYTKTINKWDSYTLGSSNAKFVKLTQSVDSTYDGDSSHKDTAVTYTYDNATGNVTQKLEYGQVTGSDDGTFTDTGTDDFTTASSFTNNTTDNIFLPYTVTVTDHGASKVKEDRYYYDTQSLGSVTKGNETKHEQWKTGTTYINAQKTYNSTYGTVATSTNPRGKVTSYTYDSYNLYPATVTDPLTHATSYTYDYSSGKVKQTTDVNSLVFQTVYDALDRPIEEKQPDQTTPSTLVTKTTYAYTDTSGSMSVHKVDYLDSSTTVDSYTYFDGLHRPIQTRQEMEDSNTFAVTDTIYNATGQVDKQSLPYSATGTSKTSPTTTTNLLAVYSYDPFARVTSVVDAAGTTSTAYSDWKVTTTDPRSKTKDAYKDAYGQLIQVDEHNSGSTYSTYYEYNGNGNLTKITDALGNVRNFTYDGLGRRLTAQDLHASSDTYYGSLTYIYDDAGNITQTVDPKSQTVNYTYDDVNRKLTEDYTGQTGTETLYTYDSCTRGIGKLCETEVVGTTLSDYQYSPTGQLSQEYENTNSVGMTTTYTYDRQGNKLEITNPDSSKVKYTYNTAGQQETIQRKESADGGYSNVVTDFDYGPHGKVTYQVNQNGTATTNTYDATKLYRLSNKSTNLVGGTSAITFDATSVSSETNNVTSVTLSHTTGTLTNGLIVVGLQIRNGSNGVFTGASSCTYNGTALTLAKVQNGDSGSGRYLRSEEWYGVNPASGAHNVVCNFSASVQMVIMGASTYSGVDQTTPLDATAGNNNLNGDTASVSITTGVANALIVDSMEGAFNTSVAVGSGQTQLWQGTPNSGTDRSGSSYKVLVSAGTTTMTWFCSGGADEWVSVAVSFKSASSGSGYGQQLAYTYDANGNITKIIDSSNTNSAKTVDYTYDDLNRLLTATTSSPASGQANYTHSFTYDAIGNILTGPSGTYTYAGNTGTSYANPHAVTSIASSGTTSTISHDATSVSSETNNVSSIALSHTTGTLTNGLIVIGLQLRNGSNGVFPSTTSCTYNGSSLTQAKVQNGGSGTGRYLRSEEWYGIAPASGAHNVVCNFSSSVQMVIMGASTYSGVDQSTPLDTTASNSNTSSDTPTVSITTGVANALVVDSMEGAFNTSMTVGSGQTQLWQGTPNSGTDRSGSSYKVLVSAGTTTMTWFCSGGADEWVSVAASFKPASTSTTTNYAYDNNGNLTGDGTWTNTWNYANRLTQSAKTGTTVSYGYDYSGQRVQLGNGTTTTLYPTKFYNTDGTTPQKHLLDNQGNAVVTVKGTGTVSVYYDHTDHLTGSNAITNSAGALEELLDYYPYGDIRLDQKANSYSEQNKFTGQEYDVDTGLNYMNARYYNSAIGRFISQDPAFVDLTHLQLQLADPQSWNSYSYARNNPLAFMDPDGNMWTPWQSSGGFGNWMSNGGFLYNVYGSNVNSLTNTTRSIQQNGWTKDNIMALGADAASITAKTSGVVLGSVGAGMGAGAAVNVLSPAVATTGTAACAGGGCEKASQVAQQSQKLLNGPINITASRLQHVVDNHTVDGLNTAGKSVFNPNENVVGLIKQGTQQAIEKAQGANFQRVFDVGRNIGVDRITNQQTSWMTIITNKAGNMITSYPGKP